MKIFTPMIIAAGLLAASVASALADPLFTINVPVSLSNLSPDALAVRIVCHLSGPSISTGQSVNVGPEMGKSLTFPLTKGVYSGPATTVIVFNTEDFSSQELPNLSAVNSVSCNLNIQGPDHTWYAPTGPAGGTPLLGWKPGTQFNNIVNAPIK